MTYVDALLVCVILIAFVSATLWGPMYIYRERVAASGFEIRRETYGGPPGVRRAASVYSHGWPSYDRVHEGSSASALANYIDST